jgi:sugar lactone lactonase YvrE
MPLNSSVPEVKTLMTGLMFGESPRWRDGRFWVSDWAAHEVIGKRFADPLGSWG